MLEAKNAALREPLESVQWCERIGRYDCCPRCGRTSHEGHNAACVIGAALAREEE